MWVLPCIHEYIGSAFLSYFGKGLMEKEKQSFGDIKRRSVAMANAEHEYLS